MGYLMRTEIHSYLQTAHYTFPNVTDQGTFRMAELE